MGGLIPANRETFTVDSREPRGGGGHPLRCGTRLDMRVSAPPSIEGEALRGRAARRTRRSSIVHVALEGLVVEPGCAFVNIGLRLWVDDDVGQRSRAFAELLPGALFPVALKGGVAFLPPCRCDRDAGARARAFGDEGV